MKNKYLVPLIFLTVIVPQVTFAAWWNPMTWKVFNRAPATSQSSEIESLKREVENLKNKTNSVPATTPTKTPSSNTTTISNSSTKLSNSQIIAKIKPAVVYIETQDGAGSGMIFSSDGYVLTNGHVVKGYTNVDISISSGETLPGKVVGRDEEADLAVIKITSSKTFSTVSFGDSTKTAQGDEVFALGFPFGIKGDVSFKEGTISRRIEGYFETSAEIHPGNSGGPLVNRYGQVIGVNTAVYGKSVSGVQIGETIKLAIPINTAKSLVADLKAGKNVTVVDPKIQKSASCLADSMKYYTNLVDDLKDAESDFSGTTDLISKIDQQIATVQADMASQISYITSQYDSLISQMRDTVERQIAGLQTSLIRSGNSRYAPGLASGSIDAARAEGAQRISSLESQKQSQISQVQSSANMQIAKYEALKSKAKNDNEQNKKDALAEAENSRVEYYNKCLSQ